MKLMIAVAAGLMALGSTAAMAQYGKPPPNYQPVYIPSPPPPPVYSRGEHHYDQRHHAACHDKAFRLHHYERHLAKEHYVSPREHAILVRLKRDLDRTCGGYRWRG